MLALAQAFNRHLPLPALDDEWITMKGTPVKIDDGGEAVTGPANVVGKAESPAKSVEEKRTAVKDAMQKISAGSKEETLPNLRDDLEQYGGTNDVTIVRGDKKKGLEHIADKHGAGVIPGVLEAVVDGKIDKFVSTKKTVHVQKDGYEAVLSLDEHGNKKTWLLTGYDIQPTTDSKGKLPGESGKVSTRHASTQTGPTFSRSGLGADSSFKEIIAQIFPKSNSSATLTLDAATLRRVDENGFLHVAASHISKECVNPYHGREIPGWEAAGLDPGRIYHGYRSGAALAAGAASFNGLPLLRDHHIESADKPQKEHRVGSLGTDASFNAPYLDNSLIITDADAIAAIESGAARELSAAYKYDPEFTPGAFRGEKYDFVMTKIRGNHVALVEEGRAGPDVLVADAAPHNLKPKRNGIMGLIDDIKKLLASAQAEGLAPDPDAEREGAAMITGTDEENTAVPAEGQEETPAEDDEAEALGTELFALIDTITDKDLAGKIKALIEKMRSEGGAADQDPDAAAEDQDPEKKAAEDGDTPGEEKKEEKKDGAAQDKKLKKRGAPAMDAAAVQRSTIEHVRALSIAARDVRPLLDVTDALAFDSAEAIYAKALKAHGVNPAPYPRSAWRGMCDMLKSLKAEQARPAFDAAPKIDPKSPFAGLNNIRVEG